MPKPVMIRDDRGRAVPLVQWSREDMNDSGNAALADALMRASETTARTGLNIRLKKRDALWIVPMVLMPFLMIGVMTVYPSAPPWLASVCIPLFMIPMMKVMGRMHLKDHAVEYVATLLGHGRCASCGYALAGVAPDEFNMTKCPECGAVWKGERVGGVEASPGAEQFSPDDVYAAGQRAQLLKPWTYKSMWNRSPSIADERQRSLALITPEEFRKRLEQRYPAEVVEDLRRDWRRETRTHAVLLTLAIAVFGSAWLFSLANSARMFLGAAPTRFTTYWPLLMFVFVITAVPFWVIQLRRAYRGQAQRTAAKVAQMLVRNGLCPACAGELPPSDSVESVSRCGCGAEWKGALRRPLY